MSTTVSGLSVDFDFFESAGDLYDLNGGPAGDLTGLISESNGMFLTVVTFFSPPV